MEISYTCVHPPSAASASVRFRREDILFEFDGTNTLKATYFHGPGIDEPLVMQRGGNDFYYHADGLGSITDLTNSSGTVVKAYVYDSFGNIVDETGSVENPYTYTARERDQESDLYYYRARYYDASVGRYLQEDPLGFVNGPNTYIYAINNPLLYIDPYGTLLFCSGPNTCSQFPDYPGGSFGGKIPNPRMPSSSDQNMPGPSWGDLWDFWRNRKKQKRVPKPRSEQGDCPPGEHMTSRGCRKCLSTTLNCEDNSDDSGAPQDPPEPDVCEE